MNKWDLTLSAIMFQLENVEEFHNTNFFEKIHVYENYYIAKVEFTIAGSKESKKSSGCRYIVRVNTKEFVSELLLIYHKSDIEGSNETVWWQSKIKNI